MRLSEIEQLVDMIRAILGADQDPPEEVVLDMARRHTEMVRWANGRLRECDEYVRKGLWTEAMERAEVPPNLDEVVGLLDFPELAEWTDYASQFGATPIPRLLSEIAAELNERYADGQPLEELLRAHRYHALARSDIGKRIAILRKLAAAEPGNPSWQKDQESYERFQLAELSRELKEATRRNDISRVAEIDEQLSSTEWSVAVPRELVKAASQSHDRLRRQRSLSEMASLSHRLSDAYSAFDRDQARTLRGRWNALADIAQLPPDHELLTIAGPALAWLQEEDDRDANDADHQRCLRDLEAALGTDTTTKLELERLYHAATRHDHELSPGLRQRVTERLRYFDQQAARRLQASVAIAAMILLALAAGTIYFVRQHTFNREVAHHVDQLRRLVENTDLVAAREYLDNVNTTNAAALSSPSLVAIVSELTNAERTEAGRQAQLEQLLAAAIDLGVTSRTWDNISAAYEQIRQSESVARTPGERARIKETERLIRTSENELQQAVDNEFRSEFSSVQNDYEGVDTDDPRAIESILKRMRQLQAKARVSAAFRAPLDALLVRVEQDKSEAEKALKIANFFQRMTEGVGRAAQFKKELEAYAAEFPNTARSSDFQRVANHDLKIVEAVQELRPLQDRLVRSSLNDVTPALAQELSSAIRKVLNDAGEFPGSLDWAQRATAYEAIAARADGTESLVDKLLRELQKPTIKSSYEVRTNEKGGRRYTLDAPPQIEGAKVSFYYFATPDGADRTEKNTSRSAIPNFDAAVREGWLSPQAKFQDQVSRVLAEAGRRTPWEEAFERVCQQLLMSRDIDELLRLLLFQKFLKTASDGSIFLSQELKSFQHRIDQSAIPPFVNWVEPDQTPTRQERTVASQVLGEFDTLADAFSAAIKKRESLVTNPIRQQFDWIGWLRREGVEDEATWKCDLAAGAPSNASGELMVFYASDESGNQKPAYAAIGIFKDGEAQLMRQHSASSNAILTEGRPVFLLSTMNVAVDDVQVRAGQDE